MGMRITDQGLASARTGWIRSGKATIADVERTISSGQKIDRPSQDPAAASHLMRSNARLRRIDQFSRNNAHARLWVHGADTALQSVANGLGRANTLAVQAGNDALGDEERSALAADIRAVSEHMLATANTRVAGRSVFGGTSDSTNAYDVATADYDGDDNFVELDIDTNETVTIGIPGPEVFGQDDADPLNGTTFQVLEALAVAVESGNWPDIQAGINSVKVATSRVGQAQGRVGAISQQIEAAEIRQSGEKIAVQANVSAVQDTDIADAIIRLRSAETSYQATLSAASRGMSTSLLDFLR